MTSIIAVMATQTQRAGNRTPTKAQSANSGRGIREPDKGFLARLKRAADDVDDNRAALRTATELRDELVTEAHDTRAMTTTEIARASGLSQTRVCQILAAH